MGNPKLLIRFLAWASAFSIFSITVDCVEVPRVEDMTLAEKIGQMAQIDKVTLGDGEALYTHMLGAIVRTAAWQHGSSKAAWQQQQGRALTLVSCPPVRPPACRPVRSGGGAAPEAGNAPGDWADMVDLYQRQANRTRLRIPVLHGIDAIHGHNIAYGATVFPHHIGIGAAHSPDLARAVGAAAAREVAATGIRWAFAPTVAVCRDARWGRCYETFGESTALVQSLVSEVEGWQAKPDSASSGDSDPAGALKGSILVAATAKHFIADGGTWGGRDEGDARISEEELRRVHLPPYREAVARGVASVMVSYSSWNGAKMHKNRRLLTGVLKGELGFAGVLVSDWEAVQRMGSPYHEQLEAAINAGLDMIMLPRDYVQFIDTLTSLVRAGRVAEARVDDAVRRILALKQSLGLFEDPYTLRSMAGLVGCPAHRELARRAVRESLVLVKNEKRAGGGSMFPLPLQGKKVLVAGTHAHNLGWQCGAWTINWQGWSGNNRTVGTTILQGIEHYAAALGGAVEFAENPAAGGGGDGKFDASAKPDSASSGDSDPAGALKGSILVAATAKHFIADGGTWGGRDEGDARISEEELRRVHLPPYREAVARGVASVMVSYSSWNGAKMHKNRRLLTGVLKGELGFAGVLVSDWEALEAAINAGLDMIMLPRDYVQFIDTLTSLVRAGRVAEARVDDAVRRILALKQSLGLFEDPYTLRSMAGLVGCPAHRELARRAVRESLVLVKNEKRAGGGSMFPLPLQGKKVLVAGTHAHNLGWQCGAWTINWQGWSGNNRTVGTTILQGIEHYAAALGGAVDSSEDRAAAAAAAGATAAGTVAAAEADYGIVVVGERTYAERFGDDTVLQLYEAGRAAVRSVCARMPCVVVLVSGRPLDVREWLPHVDALVAAWLPGTEGLGVADVLFGEHDFTGRLPLTWFREAAQLPMPPGGANYDPLFPYGYGLNKAAEVLLESGVESRSGDVRVATS
eukprot:jgi/Mesen1/4486/ME000228S03451